VSRAPGGDVRIGVHIAAPGLGIAPGSALDALARERLSTAYMPGRKYTMLPRTSSRASRSITAPRSLLCRFTLMSRPRGCPKPCKPAGAHPH